MTTWSVREVPALGEHQLSGRLAAARARRGDERGAPGQLGEPRLRPVGARDPRLAARPGVRPQGPAGRGRRRRPTDDPDRVLGYAALNLPLQDNTHLAMRRDRRPPGAPRSGHRIGAARRRRSRGRPRRAARRSRRRRTSAPSRRTARTRSRRRPVRAGSWPRRARHAFATKHGYELAQVARYSVVRPALRPGPRRAPPTRRRRSTPDPTTGSSRGRTTAPTSGSTHYALLIPRMSTDAPDGRPRLRARSAGTASASAPPRSSCEERGLGLPRDGRRARPDAHARRVHRVHDRAAHRRSSCTRTTRSCSRSTAAGASACWSRPRTCSGWRPSCPLVRRVGTWNAEENAYMLDINVTLGFRPAGGSGEWQRTL